jgi:type I restriction enzyme M protein
MAKQKKESDNGASQTPLKTKTKREQMAKQKKEIKEKAIEVTLWEAANKLRGSVEPAEYKHVVLGLIFLKFASDKFEEHRAKLIADGKEKYIEMPAFYNQNNVFFLKEICGGVTLLPKQSKTTLL